MKRCHLAILGLALCLHAQSAAQTVTGQGPELRQTDVGSTARANGPSTSLFIARPVAPSSSLYLDAPAAPLGRVGGRLVNSQLELASYAVVAAPRPRDFALQDLVTIIIREESNALLQAELETEKQTELSGNVEAFPNLNLLRLLRGRLDIGQQQANKLPVVDIQTSQEFEGEGDYKRRDRLTTRLTARVIDIKPNGQLALEARTHIQNDNETLTIAVTGYCRPDDVTPDNTVLSTQMFDLRVRKLHEGELRKATKKGWLTKAFELIFNF